MSQPNAKLKLQFDLDLMIPAGLLKEDHSALCRDLRSEEHPFEPRRVA